MKVIKWLVQYCLCQELSNNYNLDLLASHLICKNHQPTILWKKYILNAKSEEGWEKKIGKYIYWLCRRTFSHVLKFIFPHQTGYSLFSLCTHNIWRSQSHYIWLHSLFNNVFDVLWLLGFISSSNSLNFSLQLSSFSSVQSRRVWLFATPWTAWSPWTAAHQASMSITNSWDLLKFTSIELVMPWTISSSVIPFSSRLQSFPASGSFLMSQFFASGGQSIGTSASASVLPMNIQDWFTLGWTCSPRDSQSPFQHHSSKASIPQCSAFFIVQFSHWYVITGKTIA